MTRRVGELLQKLPRDINPVNLEELRRIKQALVELENKVGLCASWCEACSAGAAWLWVGRMCACAWCVVTAWHLRVLLGLHLAWVHPCAESSVNLEELRQIKQALVELENKVGLRA